MIDNFIEFDQVEYQPYNRVYWHPNGHCIYLGDASAANDERFIKQKQIGLVITAAADMDHLKFEENVKHLIYSLLDSKTENLSKHFKDFYSLIDQYLEKTNVLVHCFAGISRSATLVISYMMKKNNLTFREAITEVRKHRPKVLPNLGFQRQLKEYQKILKTQQLSMTRRLISKTSQARKHHIKKNIQIGLPEIYNLGRTLARSKNINLDLPPPKMQPSSQMENRKMRLGYFQQQKQHDQEPFIKNFDVFSNRLPIKTFRKQSISINKKKLRNMYDSEHRQPATLVRLPPNKLAVHQLKFGTQKSIKTIPLKQLRFQ